MAAVTTASTLPLFSVERHVVAFDYFGTISTADSDVTEWLGDEPTSSPA